MMSNPSRFSEDVVPPRATGRSDYSDLEDNHTLRPSHENQHQHDLGQTAKQGEVAHVGNQHPKVENGEEAQVEDSERRAMKQVGAGADLAPGSPERKRIEKRLKMKLDARFSIFVSAYLSAVTSIITR